MFLYNIFVCTYVRNVENITNISCISFLLPTRLYIIESSNKNTKNRWFLIKYFNCTYFYYGTDTLKIYT